MQPRTQGPLRMMIVLDDPVLTEVVRMTLNHGRFETRHVADGGTALRVLAEWQPHLVVMDLDIGGAEVLDALQGDDRVERRAKVDEVVGLLRKFRRTS